MDDRNIELLRNIGISAHIDSGKTTLTERILFYAGRIHKIEEVRGGGAGAKMDHMDLEKEKGITITSAATQVEWEGKRINIIDTPGHVDFTVEVERSLRVLDGAILVLCAVAGVQSQSITVDRQMKRYRVPRLAFINKMDRTGSDPDKVVADLRDKLDLNAVAMQIPIGLEDNHKGVVDLVTMRAHIFEGDNGEKLFETDIPEDLLELAQERRTEMLDAVSMFDEQMMEDLLEDKEISEEAVHAAIKKGVCSLELCPVYMGSAFKNKGVQRLLDAVVTYLPNPLEAEAMTATPVPSGDKVTLDPDPKKSLVAMAFKITEEQFGQLTYTRIYQGTLEKGSSIINARTGKKVRVGRLVRMHSNDRENIDSAGAGDIVAVVGLDCASGDTFCLPDGPRVTCESMHVALPVISLAISCKDNEATSRMGKALGRFLKEDPTFHVRTDEESGETVISGMGELHLEIYIERMRREYRVPVEVGPPQVNYREAITTPASFDYTHKKQTGGSGQYACVVGDIEPLVKDEEAEDKAPEDSDEEDKEFEFVSLIKGGNIPTEYIPACEKGFEDIMVEGPLAGFPMVGVRVTLRDGKYHDVDSSDMAFRICSRAAMKQAVAKASPGLLEPIMKVEVETPSEFQGTVIGDLSSRRGVIAGSDVRDDITVVTAQVPLAEMFGYATELRSATQGKAGYSMEFFAYQLCPRNVQEEVVAARAERLKQKSA